MKETQKNIDYLAYGVLLVFLNITLTDYQILVSTIAGGVLVYLACTSLAKQYKTDGFNKTKIASIIVIAFGAFISALNNIVDLSNTTAAANDLITTLDSITEDNVDLLFSSLTTFMNTYASFKKEIIISTVLDILPDLVICILIYSLGKSIVIVKCNEKKIITEAVESSKKTFTAGIITACLTLVISLVVIEFMAKFNIVYSGGEITGLDASAITLGGILGILGLAIGITGIICFVNMVKFMVRLFRLRKNYLSFADRYDDELNKSEEPSSDSNDDQVYYK